MIRIKEESRKDKNIKEDVPVGTLLSPPVYILSHPFGAFLSNRAQREEPQTRPLRSSCAERGASAARRIPCLNAAPLWPLLRCWKRQEDRSDKEYGLELQRNKITIIGVLCNGSAYQNE